MSSARLTVAMRSTLEILAAADAEGSEGVRAASTSNLDALVVGRRTVNALERHGLARWVPSPTRHEWIACITPAGSERLGSCPLRGGL